MALRLECFDIIKAVFPTLSQVRTMNNEQIRDKCTRLVPDFRKFDDWVLFDAVKQVYKDFAYIATDLATMQGLHDTKFKQSTTSSGNIN